MRKLMKNKKMNKLNKNTTVKLEEVFFLLFFCYALKIKITKRKI